METAATPPTISQKKLVIRANQILVIVFFVVIFRDIFRIIFGPMPFSGPFLDVLELLVLYTFFFFFSVKKGKTGVLFL